jgi:hypothetical protein
MTRRGDPSRGGHLPHGRLLIPALLVALAVQGVVLVEGTLWPLAQRVWEVRREPPLERSARLAFGDSFAGYIQFLREEVPEDARVVVPPKALVPAYGDIGLMQYFLAPRQIVDCPAGPDLPACVASMDGNKTYILSIPEFPPRESVPENKAYREHGQGYGLYTPRP